MKYRVYVAASTQKENIGVGQYGNEQDRMQYLADRIAYWLKTQNGTFEVFRNQPGWTLEQTVKDCNALACNIFIDNHSNAGPSKADGTEIYYCLGSLKGKLLAECLYAQIAPQSPGTDQGVLADSTLYNSGLYVLRNTTPPAALIEHFYHTNSLEVGDFLVNIDKYAKATAKGICAYFEHKWNEPLTPEMRIEKLIEDMYSQQLITGKDYWLKVLKGQEVVKPEYLQIVLTRAVNKK